MLMIEAVRARRNEGNDTIEALQVPINMCSNVVIEAHAMV